MKFKIFGVTRRSTFVNVYHINIGSLRTRQTCIYKSFLGIPYKILYEYRETYYGKIKETKNIKLAI